MFGARRRWLIRRYRCGWELHSGLVVTYVVASEFSRVFELGGPAQHLAVRLEAAAEAGEIYASEACKALSEGHIRFEYLGPKTLKGFVNPIPVYRVVDASDIMTWQVRKTRNVSHFVGRSNEMERLRQTAAESLQRGRAVHLIGDPGIGKSRLVHEFVHELEADGWHLIQAECSPTLQASPFAVLKSLLLSVRHHAPTHAQDGEYLWDALPPILRAAVDTVIGLPASNTQWDELTPELRGRTICEALRALIEIMADRQRTILLVEDIHWVDSASSTAIESLDWRALPRHLLVLATSRPKSAPNWLAETGSETLLVQALDEQAGRAMLNEILGASPSTSDLKSRIISHTGNVPLFIEEVCRQLKETGVLLGQWGSLTVNAPPTELGIPPNLQGVIASRIDRLPRDERRLLQIAAAIGPRAVFATLAGVTTLPDHLLRRHLASLDAAELLIDTHAIPEPSYQFPHELVRQVTYELDARTDQGSSPQTHPRNAGVFRCSRTERSECIVSSCEPGQGLAKSLCLWSQRGTTVHCHLGLPERDLLFHARNKCARQDLDLAGTRGTSDRPADRGAHGLFRIWTNGSLARARQGGGATR